MKLNYFSVAAECNVYRIKVRRQLIGKILSNIILKCASALFYVTRWPYLLMKKKKKKNSLSGGYQKKVLQMPTLKTLENGLHLCYITPKICEASKKNNST